MLKRGESKFLLLSKHIIFLLRISFIFDLFYQSLFAKGVSQRTLSIYSNLRNFE